MIINSIKAKIALATGICLVSASVLLVGYSVYSANESRNFVSSESSNLIKEEALKKLELTASDAARTINEKIDASLETAKAIATFVSSIKKQDTESNSNRLNRDDYTDVLLSFLKKDHDLNGTYSAWEPNRFDGNDSISLSRGDSSGMGRYVPYVTRDANGNVSTQPLVEYDSIDTHPNGIVKGAWYQVPKATSRETVTAPLPYIVQGKSVWLATMSAPIIVNGEFLGVAGADFNLDFVQALAKHLSNKIYQGNSRVTISTADGLLIADSKKPEFIGQTIKNVYNDDASLVISLIKKGENFVSDDTQNNLYKVLIPITFGNSNIQWGITIEVNKDIVLENATLLSKQLADKNQENFIDQILIGLLITIVATLGIIYFSHNITKPILASVNMAKIIAQGRFDHRLNHHSSDEIGQLSQALDDMAASLYEQVTVAEMISQGDLTVKVNLASQDDQLGNSLRKMVEDLNNLILQIKQRSNVIGNNALSVSELSHDLASGATQSAASVTEISATITHITEQINQSAKNAQQANSLSKQSNDLAKTGNQLMEELSLAMSDIETSGNEITKIIGAIEDIAEQTNLLALNAAIEAARAGDAGRGFAVVADEVRKLAARSAAAVQDTVKIINNSALKTKRGIELSTQTSSALKDIVDNISTVSLLIMDIAEASTLQSTGAAEINQGIKQIDQVTVHNSSNSERCADAANELTNESQDLISLVSKFKL
ncbi:HAMP domain-containing protein [Shewanella sp. ZOR0012]|uniref:methyl-accepting chemotaxis protein n=1 Tax=Shewanella TaxID=22 RepID=UPI0006473721|nr:MULTISPECIES: methyl-accepting chemotaxis protein [Shewanella]NSM24618.1 HAMP domain-containing protein [Shewanella sp. ZOR0012]